MLVNWQNRHKGRKNRYFNQRWSARNTGADILGVKEGKKVAVLCKLNSTNRVSHNSQHRRNRPIKRQLTFLYSVTESSISATALAIIITSTAVSSNCQNAKNQNEHRLHKPYPYTLTKTDHQHLPVIMISAFLATDIRSNRSESEVRE